MISLVKSYLKTKELLDFFLYICTEYSGFCDFPRVFMIALSNLYVIVASLNVLKNFIYILSSLRLFLESWNPLQHYFFSQ